MVIRLVLIKLRNRFRFKSYKHLINVKYAVVEISKHCVIRKNNQNIIMGLRYSFCVNYIKKARNIDLSNV